MKEFLTSGIAKLQERRQLSLGYGLSTLALSRAQALVSSDVRVLGQGAVAVAVFSPFWGPSGPGSGLTATGTAHTTHRFSSFLGRKGQFLGGSEEEQNPHGPGPHLPSMNNNFVLARASPEPA